MSEERKAHNNAGPAELWKRWQENMNSYYEAAARAWSSSPDGSKEAAVDPYGLYRIWLERVAAMQEQVQNPPSWLMDPQAAWKQWIETTMENWRKLTELGGDPLGLTTRWMELMEETRRKLMGGSTLPSDPFAFFKQWYDASSETWARVVEEAIGSEEFQKSSSKFLEHYASFARTFKHASEEYFKNLQLPTRSDITRVAELVVSLEEKVDTIEDGLERLEDASRNTLGLQEHLGGIESKLGTFSALLGKVEAINGLATRLDIVESKLDAVLAALKKVETTEKSKSAAQTGTARRKKQNNVGAD